MSSSESSLGSGGRGGGGGAPFLGEVFLRKERRGYTVLWSAPLGEPRRSPWTKDLGDVQGYLFCSQSPGQPPIADAAEMHTSSYKEQADLHSQWGDLVSSL